MSEGNRFGSRTVSPTEKWKRQRITTVGNGIGFRKRRERKRSRHIQEERIFMDNIEPDGLFNFGDGEFGGNDDCDDFPDDDFGDDGFGTPPPESFDIPDLPEIYQRWDPHSIPLTDAELEKIWNDERSSVETIFDTTKTEGIPGISRSLLSRKMKIGPSFGTKLCKSLAEDLNRYSDRLLFGLIDGIYLHCTRSATFERGRLSASVMFFWDEEESPFPLITPNVADITENGELTYLLVGDLLEEFLDGLENGDNGEIVGGASPKPPGKP